MRKINVFQPQYVLCLCMMLVLLYCVRAGICDYKLIICVGSTDRSACKTLSSRPLIIHVTRRALGRLLKFKSGWWGINVFVVSVDNVHLRWWPPRLAINILLLFLHCP